VVINGIFDCNYREIVEFKIVREMRTAEYRLHGCRF